MKKIISLFLLLASFTLAGAQQISLADVVFYRYYPNRIGGLNSMADGEHYSRISDTGKGILKCSFKTGETVATLFDANDTQGERLQNFSDYKISQDGRYILLETNHKAIYRRSSTANWFVYDTNGKTVRSLSKNGDQEVPHFSPDSKKVAFVRQNNLFYVDLENGWKETQVNTDGQFNHGINGKPDWAYEEEFEYNTAYAFSADSKMLAWVRTDETDVKTFEFQYFMGAAPQMSENKLYPSNYAFKYPKAGEDNAKVTALSYNLETREVQTLNVPLDADGYIPRILTTADPEKIAVVTLNRHQDRCDIYMANPRDGKAELLMSERADKYIETAFYNNLDFSKGKFVVMSERDGYRHLYLYNQDGTLDRQLTKGSFAVNDFYGTDEKGKTFYYSCNEGSPLEQYVCCVDVKGNVKRLTTQKGVNSAEFSEGCKYFINVFSDINTPYVTTLRDAKGNVVRVLEDNEKLKQAYQKLNIGKPEIFSFKTSEGVELNGWMVKPADFDASKQYPVIMYQYSGPGDQQVHNSWANGNAGGLIWEHRLAQKGYIVACVDGRGTGGRGRDFQQCTYMTMGDKESKDQVETALYLGSLPYVDKERIAIWGWSFGGFNTIMSMCEGRKVFNCGVAVAPVTDWRYYDSAYTERYMRTPQENPQGYDISPMHRYQKLSGKLLICHGLADDNVHFQNAAELCEKLVQNNTQFEMQFYTNRNHGIYGGNTRMHLFTRIENFFDKNLLK